ncbi:hypothetical protein E2C01_085739 [Portunus trituberculatus]|uniref:Uncharacterized protein n=1 Tax=Portunus trituberculatus TaxID=210409 RepID=A0A5B7IYX8_PORTR|nr:hypothetical protein [Portunus trituberculatus]
MTASHNSEIVGQRLGPFPQRSSVVVFMTQLTFPWCIDKTTWLRTRGPRCRVRRLSGCSEVTGL